MICSLIDYSTRKQFGISHSACETIDVIALTIIGIIAALVIRKAYLVIRARLYNDKDWSNSIFAKVREKAICFSLVALLKGDWPLSRETRVTPPKRKWISQKTILEIRGYHPETSIDDFKAHINQIGDWMNCTFVAAIRPQPRVIQLYADRSRPLVKRSELPLAEGPLRFFVAEDAQRTPLMIDAAKGPPQIRIYGDSDSGKSTLAETILLQASDSIPEGDLIKVILDPKFDYSHFDGDSGTFVYNPLVPEELREAVETIDRVLEKADHTLKLRKKKKFDRLAELKGDPDIDQREVMPYFVLLADEAHQYLSLPSYQDKELKKVAERLVKQIERIAAMGRILGQLSIIATQGGDAQEISLGKKNVQASFFGRLPEGVSQYYLGTKIAAEESSLRHGKFLYKGQQRDGITLVQAAIDQI